HGGTDDLPAVAKTRRADLPSLANGGASLRSAEVAPSSKKPSEQSLDLELGHLDLPATAGDQDLPDVVSERLAPLAPSARATARPDESRASLPAVFGGRERDSLGLDSTAFRRGPGVASGSPSSAVPRSVQDSLVDLDSEGVSLESLPPS